MKNVIYQQPDFLAICFCRFFQVGLKTSITQIIRVPLYKNRRKFFRLEFLLFFKLELKGGPGSWILCYQSEVHQWLPIALVDKRFVRYGYKTSLWLVVYSYN